MSLLNAPSATPSRAANAITSGGLITRLKELTIDSPKAPSEPTISARYRPPRLSSLVRMSPVMYQVIAAVTMTIASEMPVFWTTESMVIRSPERVGACGSA